MSDEQKLPADFALLALTAECERRGGISYGQLVAHTTLQEREQIVEGYRVKGQQKDRTQFAVKTISGRHSCK